MRDRNCERPLLTEDMKLEAVVVTVVRVEEEEYLSALARKVHITALQVKSSPPHSSLSGMWSWKTTQKPIKDAHEIWCFASVDSLH